LLDKLVHRTTSQQAPALS